MKLSKIEVLKGTLTCESGLLICGADNGLSIGALSAEFISNPLTKEPYIPGSSLKGKLRCILEQEQGHFGANGDGTKNAKKRNGNKENNEKDTPETEPDGSPCGCGTCINCKLFGSHSSGKEKQITRLIVRDASLSDKSRQIIEESDYTEDVCHEIKVENVIDRQKGSTISGGMRTNQRVSAGMKFDYELVLQTYDADNEKDIAEYKETIEKGLKLIEFTYLGGSGSRGYGKVKFSDKEPEKWETIYPFPNDAKTEQ